MAKTKAKTIKKTVSVKKKPAAKVRQVKKEAKTPKLAPNITLPATGGQVVNLVGLKGKKVVLYFYPKDLTPGCTIEGHEFTKLKNEFSKMNAVVYGVSRDTVELHEKFKAKECYAIDLISDEKEKLCRHFDVIKDKNMYGKMVKGIERSTFLIDEEGAIAHEWRGVKAEGHAAQVLDFLKQK